MAILVTGGAGYIGSHTVVELLEQGEQVIVIDNLQTGHKKAVKGTKGTFYCGDIRDTDIVDKIFKTYDIEAVIHFAANALVAESVRNPLKYYENNLLATHTLLGCMLKNGINKIVFSSTAATYGEPKQIPITENDPTVPVNPYGETKLAIEKMFQWYDQAYGLKSVSLRYFNAAGAHPECKIGEDHEPESHLIPIILQVALGQRDMIEIFGADYATHDGTCIRDFVHVTDLAKAHCLALDYLRHLNQSGLFNLGSGKGFSIKEVIKTARRVTKHPIPEKIGPRRPGDPAQLVASAEKARKELSWQPKYSDLENMISTAWRWHKNNPKGYGNS